MVSFLLNLTKNSPMAPSFGRHAAFLRLISGSDFAAVDIVDVLKVENGLISYQKSHIAVLNCRFARFQRNKLRQEPAIAKNCSQCIR